MNTEQKPIVMRGKIGDKNTYARIPIINKFPLPNANTHPIEALFLYLRYLTFILKHKENSTQDALEIIENALEVFKTFEIIDTQTIQE